MENLNTWINSLPFVPADTSECHGSYHNERKQRIEYWRDGEGLGWITSDIMYEAEEKGYLKEFMYEYWRKFFPGKTIDPEH